MNRCIILEFYSIFAFIFTVNYSVNCQCFYTGLCYTKIDKGVSYRGNVAVTESGKPCIPWGRHLHTFTPAHFPYAGLDLNYCRNPLGKRVKPWCYTSMTGKEDESWEFCNVPKCDTCLFRGAQLKLGDQFHDGCSMCICQESGLKCLECEGGPMFTNKLGCYVKFDNSLTFPKCCPKIVCHGENSGFDMTEYFHYLQFVLRNHQSSTEATNTTEVGGSVTVLP